jgi:hypothetical protein
MKKVEMKKFNRNLLPSSGAARAAEECPSEHECKEADEEREHTDDSGDAINRLSVNMLEVDRYSLRGSGDFAV